MVDLCSAFYASHSVKNLEDLDRLVFDGMVVSHSLAAQPCRRTAGEFLISCYSCMHHRYGIIRLAIRCANYKKFRKRPNNRCTGSAHFSVHPFIPLPTEVGVPSRSARFSVHSCRLKLALPVENRPPGEAPLRLYHCTESAPFSMHPFTPLPAKAGAPGKRFPVPTLLFAFPPAEDRALAAENLIFSCFVRKNG